MNLRSEEREWELRKEQRIPWSRQQCERTRLNIRPCKHKSTGSGFSLVESQVTVERIGLLELA